MPSQYQPRVTMVIHGVLMLYYVVNHKETKHPFLYFLLSFAREKKKSMIIEVNPQHGDESSVR